ncbi:hypothetical protein ACB092_06G065200 [Castanea dentata]
MTPERLAIGVSLLATHTTASVDILYHIPKYRPFELPGPKNPNSKVPPAETEVSPSLIEWLGMIVSIVAESLKKNSKQNTKRERKVLRYRYKPFAMHGVSHTNI